MKRKVFIAIISVIFLIFLVFVSYNHLWRIGGFKSCVDPDDYTVLKYEITDNGFSMIIEKGDVYNTGIKGCLFEYENKTLKIGIKYYSGYISLIDKSPSVDKITIPLISDDIEKIILCGEESEIDIRERYNEEQYLSIKEYIDKMNF